MAINYTALKNQPRLLIEATLKPLQGERFQPTGFADLGPAVYKLPDDSQHLLVESAQSVANYLEKACWDEGESDLITPLKGLPYVKIDCGRFGTTTTLHEFHRLNSPYLWKGDDNDKASAFRSAFCAKLGINVPSAKKADKESDDEGSSSVPGVLNRRKMTDAIFWFDPCSLIHGVFLEKIDGRMRVTRALSGFIEAAKGTARGNPKKLFADVLDAIRRIQTHCDGKTRDDYLGDEVLRGFVERKLLIVGEALAVAAESSRGGGEYH